MRRLRSIKATAIASAALLISAVMRAICSSGLSPSRRCIISDERANGESSGGSGIDPALPSDTEPAPWLPPPPPPPAAEKERPPPNSPAKAARKLPTAALSPDISVACRCCTCPKWQSSFEKLKARSTFEPENTKPLRANFTPSMIPCAPFRLKIVSMPCRFNRSRNSFQLRQRGSSCRIVS